ncbi:hypothetical protein GCM10010335_60370 [Streptomyces galbus]|nr:hypothetical protein GCM10010335_60370 [Streptomyces galbus]
MAWFGEGETLGKLVAKVRAGRVSSSRAGSSLGAGPVSGAVRGGNGDGEQQHPSTAVTVDPCGRDKWSLAQRRGALRRARKADRP